MISIIVPVYNSEKYIKECIDSIARQSFTDFEAIFVDDGSTDNSYTIISEYASCDHRIKLYHQNNAGVSAARNLGLFNAVGEYIAFIDSDDTIDVDYLLQLHQGICTTSSDVVMSGIICMTNNKESYRGVLEERTFSLDTGRSFVDFFNIFFLTSPVAKLYKKEIIRKYGIQFDTSISFAEDKDFNLYYFQYVRFVCSLAYCGYFYRNVGNSLSKKKYDYKYRVEHKHWKMKREMIESHGNYGKDGTSYLVNQLFYIVSDELTDIVCSLQSIRLVFEKWKDSSYYVDWDYLKKNCILLKQPFWVKFIIKINCSSLLVLMMYLKCKYLYAKSTC